ncbi:MAG TPA: membrane protein insertion efficiency factor YidD [bacterium]|nr:membrane protein insertion efficiency factor YidD [bacterium]
MRNCFKNLVRFYRIFLSPILGGQCRFEPTCSSYALEALDRYPLRKALAKSAKRVLSCHPYHSGGFDPV